MGHVARQAAHAGSLDASLRQAFDLLEKGVADRRHPLHTPVLGSVARDGRPRLRVLVLRGFDATSRTLRLHTDMRSEKCAEMQAEPRVSLLGYDPGRRVQIRLEGQATLHAGDAVAEAGWAASRPMSRMCYAADPAPGHPVGAPPWAPQDAEAGRTNFAVIALRFDRLEWLWLAAEGHQRALFRWDGGPTATWLVP